MKVKRCMDFFYDVVSLRDVYIYNRGMFVLSCCYLMSYIHNTCVVNEKTMCCKCKVCVVDERAGWCKERCISGPWGNGYASGDGSIWTQA